MTEASPGTGSEARAALPAGPVWRAGLLAALPATVVNGLAWVLLQQVLDAGLQLPSQPGGTEPSTLPLAAVLFVTAFSGLVLFHRLATATELVVVRQQLARWATA